MVYLPTSSGQRFCVFAMSSVDGERRGEFGKVSFRRKTAEADKSDYFIPSACIRRVHLTSLYSLMELPTTTDSNAPRAPLLLRFACHAPLFHSTLPPKHARSSRLLLRELRTTIWLESTAVANTETTLVPLHAPPASAFQAYCAGPHSALRSPLFLHPAVHCGLLVIASKRRPPRRRR